MNNYLNKLKSLFLYIKTNYVTFLTLVYFISLFLLILVSPVCSLLFLCVFSFFFSSVYSYKSILKIWCVTISGWYLIFTTTLSEITIIIGFENTKIVLKYLLENPVLFTNLCFQTVYILDILSAKLGFSIYIPAIINVFGLSKMFR
nr:hypothetical protein orf145 [Navicula sp.]WPV72418.1 hypothetical protein orf145 [Navicula sp.]